jgi:hypothetical protein
MQGVLVFASAAARDAAITSPQEGQFAYLKDTNVTTYYTGSAWTNLDTTGMTNPMTTTGDMVYSSSGSTPARLGIGSTGQVITVAGGIPSWATPASGGGMTLLSTTSTTTGSSYTVSSISQDYIHLQIIWQGLSCTGGAVLNLAFASSNSATGGVTSDAGFTTTLDTALKLMPDTQSSGNTIMCNIFNYTVSNTKNIQIAYGGVATGWRGGGYQGFHNYSSGISSFTVSLSTGSFSAGSLKLYGVK